MEVTKEQIDKTFDGIHEINHSVSRFILYFTMILIVILFEYSSKLLNPALDVVFVGALLIPLVTLVIFITGLVYDLQLRNIINIVLTLVSIVIIYSIIPVIGFEYEHTPHLMSTVWIIYSKLMSYYIIYLLVFGWTNLFKNKCLCTKSG